MVEGIENSKANPFTLFFDGQGDLPPDLKRQLMQRLALLDEGIDRHVRVNEVACPPIWTPEMTGRADSETARGGNGVRSQELRHAKPRRHIHQVCE